MLWFMLVHYCIPGPWYYFWCLARHVKSIVHRVPEKTKISDSDGRKWKRKIEPFFAMPMKIVGKLLCPARPTHKCCGRLAVQTGHINAISAGNFHHSGSINFRALFRAFVCKWGGLLRDEGGRNHKRWRRHDVLNPAIALGEPEDARPRMTLSFRACIWSSHFEHRLYHVISSWRWFKCRKDAGWLTHKNCSNVFSPLVRFQNSKNKNIKRLLPLRVIDDNAHLNKGEINTSPTP